MSRQHLKTQVSLKLNSLNEQSLSEKEMNAVKGGSTCGCGCCYANNGGSTTEANGLANYDGGKHTQDCAYTWTIE